MLCRLLLLCVATLCLSSADLTFQKVGKGPGILLIHGFGGNKEGLVPCLMAGHSMGGPIAARTVLEDPGDFRGLVLVDSFLSAIPEAYLEPTAVALTKDPVPALAAFYSRMTTGPAQTGRLAADALKVPIPALVHHLPPVTQEGLGLIGILFQRAMNAGSVRGMAPSYRARSVEAPGTARTFTDPGRTPGVRRRSD